MLKTGDSALQDSTPPPSLYSTLLHLHLFTLLSLHLFTLLTLHLFFLPHRHLLTQPHLHLVSLLHPHLFTLIHLIFISSYSNQLPLWRQPLVPALRLAAIDTLVQSISFLSPPLGGDPLPHLPSITHTRQPAPSIGCGPALVALLAHFKQSSAFPS